MGLRTKFNLVLLVALTIGLGLAAVLSERIVERNAREAVTSNARIMMEAALAIRGYTAREIAPLLRPQMNERFLPHTVPSFAAQTNFRLLQEQFPEYSYKEAALNPTNRADLATDWEADIINQFRGDNSLEELTVIRDTPLGQFLVLAKPLQINDPGCLVCHSDPDIAPATMLAMYGPNNGFGWELGEIIGAQVVSVPMAVPLERAQDTLWIFLGSLLGIFVLIAVLLNLMLHYIVIRPVVRISNLASEVSMGNLEAPEYELSGKDEIASLIASFNRMRRSLESAMRMLNE